jgi:citrate lyase subunit beta / citryl-CoA lyase
MTENRPRIIRSMTFAPAHDPEAILAAAGAGVEAVGADLEDLTPGSEKERARTIFREVAAELASRGTVVTARTNALGAGCAEDLDAIVCPELHFVNIPKAETGDEVREFCRLLEAAELRHGLPAGRIHVRPVIETANGIRNAYEIAAASERVCYMGGVAGSFWGDLGATLGLMYGPDGMDSYYLRAKVAVDVRSAGRRFPIGGGSISSRDPQAFRDFCWQTRRLGYTGHYLSPVRQLVEIAHEVYTPTAADVAEFREVLPALEQARSRDQVVVLSGDHIYDTAAIERIRDLLELVDRVGVSAAVTP